MFNIDKKFISLFGGIGGFDLALIRQGWENVWYNDFDKYAVKTYNKNFGTDYEPKDIRNVDAKQIPEHTLLCAGFPCQSFSIAGKRKGFADTRGTMFFEICRIAKECRTPFLLLENVKGLLSHDEGRTFRTILRCLDELGYDAEWQVLNSKHFSVPQNRERVFIIANLRTHPKQQIFPIGESNGNDTEESGVEQVNQPKHAGYRTYGVDGMSPSLRARARDDAHSSPKIEIIPRFDVRKGRKCLKSARTPEIEILNLTPHFVVEMNTLTEATGNRAGSSMEFLSTVERINKVTGQVRRLTPVECERLQGFPDGWIEGVSDTQRYKQCGNAVTVSVIERIAQKLDEVFANV